MITQSFLFPGEIYVPEQNTPAPPAASETIDFDSRYQQGENRIVTEQARYPLNTVPNMVDCGDYILNPEYQRRKRWDDARKSRLIESFIINVPIPPVFLYEVEYSKYEVMDGLQRMSSIADFYNDKFALVGLELWEELNGRVYSELPDVIRRGIDRRYLSSIILLTETAKTQDQAKMLKQLVFERLNSGGELLSAQEVRNALHNGKFNKKCIFLSENQTFRKLWRIPAEDSNADLKKDTLYRSMEDVELVLRFFAYRQVELQKGPVDKFLDSYLKQANSFDDNLIDTLGNVFLQTIELVHHIYGEDAFVPPQTSRKQHQKPLKVVYDPIMQAFSKFLKSRDQLIQRKDKLQKLKNELGTTMPEGLGASTHTFDGRYTNTNFVKTRIGELTKRIESVLQ